MFMIIFLFFGSDNQSRNYEYRIFTISLNDQMEKKNLIGQKIVKIWIRGLGIGGWIWWEICK